MKSRCVYNIGAFSLNIAEKKVYFVRYVYEDEYEMFNRKLSRKVGKLMFIDIYENSAKIKSSILYELLYTYRMRNGIPTEYFKNPYDCIHDRERYKEYENENEKAVWRSGGTADFYANWYFLISLKYIPEHILAPLASYSENVFFNSFNSDERKYVSLMVYLRGMCYLKKGRVRIYCFLYCSNWFDSTYSGILQNRECYLYCFKFREDKEMCIVEKRKYKKKNPNVSYFFDVPNDSESESFVPTKLFESYIAGNLIFNQFLDYEYFFSYIRDYLKDIRMIKNKTMDEFYEMADEYYYQVERKRDYNKYPMGLDEFTIYSEADRPMNYEE